MVFNTVVALSYVVFFAANFTTHSIFANSFDISPNKASAFSCRHWNAIKGSGRFRFLVVNFMCSIEMVFDPTVAPIGYTELFAAKIATNLINAHYLGISKDIRPWLPV